MYLPEIDEQTIRNQADQLNKLRAEQKEQKNNLKQKAVSETIQGIFDVPMPTRGYNIVQRPVDLMEAIFDSQEITAVLNPTLSK